MHPQITKSEVTFMRSIHMLTARFTAFWKEYTEADTAIWVTEAFFIRDLPVLATIYSEPTIFQRMV